MDHLMTAMAVFAFGLIAAVLNSLRGEHIRVEYSVSWLVAGLALLAISRMAGVVEWLGGVLGVAYPPVALLIVVMGVFLAVFYRFSMVVSQLKDANIALTQKVAILEHRLERAAAGQNHV